MTESLSSNHPLGPSETKETEPKTKSNTVVSTVYDEAGQTLKFIVLKASATGGSMTLSLDLAKVGERNKARAQVHGFEQRIRDAAAIPFNAKEKRYATPREKYDAMAVLVEHYNSGAEGWSPKRAERVGSDELLLTRALSEAYPDKGADYVRSKVAGWTRAERLAMMEHPNLKPIVERLKSEQMAETKVDAEELLKGF